MQLKFSADGEPEDLFARLMDTNLNLILVGEHPAVDVSKAFEGIISELPIPADPFNLEVLAGCGIPSQAFYLLRPDGHIGLAGRELDHTLLSRYLKDFLCLKIGGA